MKPIMIFAMILLLLQNVSGSFAATKVKSLCEISYPSDDRIDWECRKLKWTDTPQALFGEQWQAVLRFNRMDRRHFHGDIWIKVPKDSASVRDFTPLPASYPDAAGEEKFILVDQKEMFLGAYEHGRLVFSFPVAVGIKGHRVPNGEFRIDAVDRWHKSNLYTVEEIGRPYPMHYGLRFFVDKSVDGWPSYWIHGRDVPGYPASHGCLGLYDEEMQEEYYGAHDRKVNRPHYHPFTKPYLEDARRLYRWVVGSHEDSGRFHKISYGPRVLITGEPPI